MNDQLLFDTVSKENDIIAQHLAPHERVVPGEDALIADLSGAKLSFLCAPPWRACSIPAEGDWYAVSMRNFVLSFGLGGLHPYRISTFPNRPFQLGCFSQVGIRVAHLHGFRRWVIGQKALTTDALFQSMYELIYNNVQTAISSVLPKDSSYDECVSAQRQMEAAIESTLFPIFYENGICMRPNTYRIINFTKPVIEFHQ